MLDLSPDLLHAKNKNTNHPISYRTGETELKLTFFFGYVTNISHIEDFIKFNAQNLFYLVFQPLSFGSYNSGEEIIAKQVLALTIEGNPGIVIGFYKISLL